MAIDPGLYRALADALSRPSGAYRAASEALSIPKQAVEGYKYGAELSDSIRKRKLGQQTLAEALGGNLPAGLEGFGNTTVEGAGALAKPIEAIAALDKARREGLPKPGENYTPEQAEAVSSGDPAKLQAAFAGPVDPTRATIPRTAVAANTTARGITGKNDFYGTRAGQINLQQLPSEMTATTAPGAAYQVKVAARQGMSLISSPGSYQRLGLTQGDAARAILRNSPTDEAMKSANFSDSFINQFNKIKQKITSDPTAIDQPLLRKELYDILHELDTSATPFIANHLANRESYGLTTPVDVKRRELGLNLPEIPFEMGPSTGTVTNWKTAKNAQGVMIRSKDNWATFEPVPQGQ